MRREGGESGKAVFLVVVDQVLGYLLYGGERSCRQRKRKTVKLFTAEMILEVP